MKNDGLEMEVRRHALCAARNPIQLNEAIGLWENRLSTQTIEPGARPGFRPRLGKLKRKVVLLVSAADGFGRSLNHTADLLELGFQQTHDPARGLWLAGRTRAAVVFVDLDLPTLAGWNVAERLLHDESSPALILLTERSGDPDLGAAIRSGAVVGKAVHPVELLVKLSQALAEPDSDRIGRIARQWMLLRWLRPCDYLSTATATGRFQGINE